VVQNGACTFANSTVTTITINPPAVVANAGTNQEVCNVTSYLLNGNSASPGTGIWTVTSSQTGVTFSNPTLPNATVSGLVPGQTYQFTWTVTPGAPCSPNSSSVTITDDAPSVGGTTAGANTFCAGSGNNGTITLSGQLGAVIGWESSTDNGSTWQAIANTATSQPYLNLTQTTQYRAVVQNGVCTFANSTVTTIVINPQAVPANAGTNQQLCNVTSYTLNGNNPSPGTGLWTVTSSQTGVIFSDPTQANATVSGLIPGQIYKLTWTITPTAPCTPNSSTVTITDDAPTIGGTSAGTATVCSGNNNGSITLTGQLGNVLRWESSTDNGATWLSVANTTPTLAYANLNQTTQFRASVQNGVCTFGYSSVTTIIVNPPAVTANAGTNQTVCNATSYVLQGNNPFPATGLWTVTSGQTGVTFSDPTQPTPTVSGLIPGQTYQFTWTITPSAPCSPNSSSVTITDDAPSVGGTTAGANTFCAGNNISGTITLSGQLGAILRWESSTDNGATWQSIANTSTSQQYLNLTQTTQYRAVVQNGACTFAYSTISAIVVDPPAVPANAGANQELCNATSAVLQGNNPTPSTGLWTLVSGQTGVTFSDPTQPNATVSGLTPGQTYQFTWTVTAGPQCTPNSSSVTITDDAPSVGGTTGGGTTYCAGSNISGTISLSGQLGRVLRWESSVDNGSTWQAIGNTTTTQPYLNLGQTTQYRAVVQNGLCTFAYSTVSVIIITPPAVMANAGADQEICNVSSYVLQGNNPSPGTGLWTVISGQTGVVFSDATQPNAVVSGLVPGQTYQFTWSITSGPSCTPNSSLVTITDDAPTVGGTTSGANVYCAGSPNSGAIILNGQVGRILRWESSTDNGTTWQQIVNTTTTQQYINLLQTTQYRAVVQNGVCSFANSTVSTIVINAPAVQANAGTNQEICNASFYVLQGNNPSPGAGLWTVTSGQTGIVFSDPTKSNATVTGMIPGNTYQFTWTVTPGAPCTPNSSTVTITDDKPTVGGTTSSDATVCAGSNGATITLTGQLGNILRWETSTDNGASWQAIVNTSTTQQYVNLIQTTQYRAVVQNGVCNFAYSSVTTITVNQAVPLANAGGNQQLCGATSFTLQGNNPAPFTGIWTQTSGPVITIVSPNNYQTQVTGLVPGNTYTFLWTIKGQAPCPDSSDPVQIHDLQDVVASFVADKTDGCGPYTVNFTNTSSSLTGVSFLWNFGDGTPTSTAVNPSHDFVPRTDGRDTTYTVSLNIVNNCAQRAPYTVNVTIRPDAPIAYILPQQLIGCSPFTLAVDNYSPGTNKSYTYYLYDGSVLVQQIVTTNKNQVRFNPINVSATKTYSLYMIATGFCGNTGQSKIIPITISVSTIVAQMFIENNANKGCAPFTVNFVNNSIGADTYYYTIYDVNHVVVDRRQGGVSMLPYTFNKPGTYYVTVTAMNSCSTAESNPPIRVDVYPPPLPAFTADLTSGCRNVLVTFTNTTPNDANTQAASMFYDWDFGDGSPHANGFTPPPHSYSSKNSPFTVTLTATNSATGCTNSASKINYIIITPPPGAEFTEKPDSVTTIPNYGFAFIDKTTGIPKYWNWNFGDGQVSTTQNPYHTYPDTGLYKVTLTTISQLGCDSTISHYVRITGTPGQVFLPNAFQPDGASIELRTFTAKGSGMKEWHMQIFNNYAQCIWETRKLDDKGAPVDGWDGTYKGSPMPQGVYVWQITARFINGTDWKGNVIKKSVPSVTGVIHLIR
jgi:PKD repeat protein